MTQAAQGLTRRQFIRMTATAGVLLAGGVGLTKGLSARHPAPVHETRLLLGSIANLTIISDDPAQARAAISAAFDRMATLEAIFSRFRPDSQLSQLNRSGQLASAHPSMREVLTRAVDYGQLTAGAFDITIEPVHQLYREHVRSGTLPADEAVHAASQLVDYRQVYIAGDGEIRLGKPGMAITLDGIAKGYIIDQGAAALAAYGFGNVMVEIGGDLHTLGDTGARPWQVGIREPTVAQEPRRLTAQVRGALATSGDYLNTFTADRRLHHILDPASGISPGEVASASVIAATACDADALATALVVMGQTSGMALIDRLPGAEALVISKRGDIQRTTGFPLV